jgi:hypothetical protein
MKKYYTYILEDLTGNVFYVGKGCKTESYDRVEHHIKYWHTNKNRKLVNKIKKIGGSFKVVIVFESEIETECLDKEIYLIKRYGRNSLCNLTDGGEGVSGYKHLPEAKAKMSAHADRDKAKRNLINAVKVNTGKRKGDAFCLEELYKTHSIYEIKEVTGLDFVTIKRYLVEKGLYVKNKNRKQTSAESRQKKSEGQRNRKRKEVLQFDLQGNLINTWSNTKQASENIKGDIRACLTGKQRTAGGFVWKYKEQ